MKNHIIMITFNFGGLKNGTTRLYNRGTESRIEEKK